MRRPAVLVDCSTRGGLAVVRSLARQGVAVHAVAERGKNVAFRSRYLRSRTVVPGFLNLPAQTADVLQQLVASLHKPVLIPLTDAATEFLNSYRSRFSGEVTLALNEPWAIERVLNKSKNLEIAKEKHIPCPQMVTWTDEVTPQTLVAALGLPLVVKNPYPESASPEDAWPFRFEIIRDQQQLIRCLKGLESKQPRPIFQQYVSGYAVNVCCFAVKGELVAAHQYVSLRRSDHAGILREIVPVRSELKEYAQSMVGALNWTGPAHLGFVESLDGKSVWYMETNGRFWASVQGSVHAGWDIPYWMYNHYVSEALPKPGPIKVGSQTCYRPGDLRVLVTYLFGGQSPTFYTNPGKWRSVRSYLASFRPGVHSDVCSWRDPWPGIADFGRVLSELARFALRRLRTIWRL